MIIIKAKKIPRHIEGGTTEISPVVQLMLWKRSFSFVSLLPVGDFSF
ncbi:MAG: hypothetical protein ABJO02_19960 [Reichenbachiella sp.]